MMADLQIVHDPLSVLYSDIRFLRTYFNGDYFCNLCNDRSKTDEEWRCHYIDDHTEMKSVACPDCSHKFIYICDLTQHLKLNHGKADIYCYICDRIYRNAIELKYHVRDVHSTFQRSEQQRDFEQGRPPSESFLRPIQFKCNKCRFDAISKGGLFRHYKSRHITYYCFICNWMYLSWTGVRNHIRIIHYERAKLFNCDTCTQTFNTKDTLDLHCFFDHEVRRYRCAACDNISFPSQQWLLVHHQIVHTETLVPNIHQVKNEPYKCDLDKILDAEPHSASEKQLKPCMFST